MSSFVVFYNSLPKVLPPVLLVENTQQRRERRNTRKGISKMIVEILKEKKVFQLGFASELDKYKYIYEQSGGAMNLDFAGSIPAASLAVFDDIIYNKKDFGNFLWGATMQKLGVPFGLVNAGSEFNGFWNGKAQNGNSPKFYIDRITWSGNAHEDQVAIRNGYLWALKNPSK
jgi:hypothetical protein